MKLTRLSLVFLLSACRIATPEVSIPQTAHWSMLPTAAYKGKQDDIFFRDANLGWYVNGEGKIYKTVDGGRALGLEAEPARHVLPFHRIRR